MRTKAEISNHDWFGNLPKGWEMRPLKSIFTFSKGLNITKNDLTETGNSVISYGQIHSKDYFGTGIVDNIIRYVPDEIVEKGDSSLVAKGGFVFADTSEDLAGVGNCAYNNLEKTIYGGYHTIVLNPLYETDNKFLAYQFRTDAWRHQLRRQLVDVKLFSVNQRILSEAYVVLPPADVRRSIVSFLDARCDPIDEAISRHRQAIEKLEEYRRSVVTKAVTKGLGSNASLKSCGVSWIGLIPREWQLTKIKYVAKVMAGATPKSDVSEYWDGDIPFVTPADYSSSDHYISNGSRCITKEGMNSCSTSLLPNGSVIVSTRAPIGLVTVNTKPVCINQGCKGLVRRNEDFDFEYLYLLLSIADKALIELGNGTTYLELSKKSLSNFVIPKPSLQEQHAIVSYLNDRCAIIDKAVTRHRLLIRQLEEYRQSLIHAAVTGRIDCTKEPL